MALYKCPECGHIISDRADACPNCGYVLKTYTNPNNNANNRHNITIILAVIALIAALALIGILLYKSNSANNSETSASTETIVQDSAVVNDSVIEQAPRQASYEKSSILNGDVFTLVYTTSDDNFLNIRSKPSMVGVVLGEIKELYNWPGYGVLIKKGSRWSRVRKGDVEGWVSNKYLGCVKWYYGRGSSVLVANMPQTTIYLESNADEGSPYIPYKKVSRGTIIADEYSDNGEYYVLETAHDYLFVKKGDVIVMSREEVGR